MASINTTITTPNHGGRKRIMPAGARSRHFVATDEDWTLANQIAADEIARAGYKDASSASLVYRKALHFFVAHHSSISASADSNNGRTPTS